MANKPGRKSIDPAMKRVQRTITLSPEANAIVEAAIAVKRKPYTKNRSAFIESKIMPEQNINT